jgi:hypothetical protein
MKLIFLFLFGSVISLSPVVNAFVAASGISVVSPAVSNNSAIIATSAGNNQVFFGQSAVQVVITDLNSKSGGGMTQSTIPVSIIAESIERKKVAANTFDIPETVLGTGQFEFYLTHHESRFANGAGIHPINAFGVASLSANKNQTFQLASPGVGKLAPVITFGSGGDLDTGTGLFQAILFKIIYKDEQIPLFYEKTPSQLILDRDTYGSNSVIHAFITSQNANLNPTVPDEFTVSGEDIKSLFSLSGGTIDTKNSITFTETGPNTAIFEGSFRLGDTINATSKSLVLALHDKPDYNNITSSSNIDRIIDTSDVSFKVEDSDGNISVPSPVTSREGLKLILADYDENEDSEIADTIVRRVNVTVQGGGDSEILNMKETDANSGIFVIDNSNNTLKILYLNGTRQSNNGILELTNQDVHNDIIMTYSDAHNHEGIPQSYSTRVNFSR